MKLYFPALAGIFAAKRGDYLFQWGLPSHHCHHHHHKEGSLSISRGLPFHHANIVLVVEAVKMKSNIVLQGS